MKRALVVLLALVALTACNEEANKDPRNGVVYLEKHNCLGECYSVTKVCLGPDLIWRDTRLSDENEERVVANAPECEASR